MGRGSSLATDTRVQANTAARLRRQAKPKNKSKKIIVTDPKLVSKRVIDLTEDEFDSCSKLNYGRSNYSPMKEMLLYHREKGLKSARAIMIKDGDKVVAWALVAKMSGKQHPKNKAMFYVPPQYRRQGLGRKLGEVVQKHHPSAQVAPWNPASRSFFDNFKLPTDPNYRW